MIIKTSQQISAIDEFLLLTKEAVLLLFGEVRNLIICLMFPALAALVTVWIAGKNMFVNMESTKSACFILTCAAIWGGLFNSIQIVVKERPNIRRDYVSGALRIGCYILSRSAVQLVLCAVQCWILCCSIPCVSAVYGNSLPEEGVLLSNVFWEYYVSLFLTMYAADSMGILISCLVRSEQLASQLSPYILIVQLLFSGVLFKMTGAATGVSGLMVSRWSMEALGNTSDLNGIPSSIAADFPMYTAPFMKEYEHSVGHLLQSWLILLLFSLVSLIAGGLLLRRIRQDRRG